MQTLQALETRMTCEVCGNVGHSGDNCPETQEEALILNGNNGFCPQGDQGWNQPCPYYQEGNENSNSFNPNQPTLRDLVYGQVKIDESLQKKLAAIDKSMETIHAKMDGFSTAMKNQLSFNKALWAVRNKSYGQSQIGTIKIIIPLPSQLWRIGNSYSTNRASRRRPEDP